MRSSRLQRAARSCAPRHAKGGAAVELDPSPFHVSGPNIHLGRDPSPRSRIRKDGFAMNHDSQSFVGIDVAKQHLDVCILPQKKSFQLPYGEEGLKELIDQLLELKPTLIVVEATGGYERRVAAELLAAGLALAVVNPARVRQLAKGHGTLAKNDRIDAYNLALFAQIVRPTPRRKTSQKQDELNDLVARRRQLVEMIVMEGNRLEKLPAGSVQESIAKIVTLLKEQRQEMDNQIAEH